MSIWKIVVAIIIAAALINAMLAGGGHDYLGDYDQPTMYYQHTEGYDEIEADPAEPVDTGEVDYDPTTGVIR